MTTIPRLQTPTGPVTGPPVAPIPSPRPGQGSSHAKVTLKISASRDGDALTIGFSAGLPPPVLNMVATVMTDAARYSAVRAGLAAKASGVDLRSSSRKAKAAMPPAKEAATGSQVIQPFSVKTNGILPDLDRAVTDAVGLFIATWQKYGSNPQPSVTNIQFDDEVIVGKPLTSGGDPPEEPGLISEPWVTGLMAGAVASTIAGVFDGAGKAGIEAGAAVAGEALDYLREQFTDMLNNLSKDPAGPPIPMDRPLDLDMGVDPNAEPDPSAGNNSNDEPDTDPDNNPEPDPIPGPDPGPNPEPPPQPQPTPGGGGGDAGFEPRPFELDPDEGGGHRLERKIPHPRPKR